MAAGETVSIDDMASGLVATHHGESDGILRVQVLNLVGKCERDDGARSGQLSMRRIYSISLN